MQKSNTFQLAAGARGGERPGQARGGGRPGACSTHPSVKYSCGLLPSAKIFTMNSAMNKPTITSSTRLHARVSA